MAWVDGLHIGSVVGPEAKQKDTRYPYPYLVLCTAVGSRHGRAGQGRAGQGGRYVSPSPCPPPLHPCPLAPALHHPCQHLVWEGSQGGPRASQSSAGRPVARFLPWDQRGGVEAIDGTEQGSFCPQRVPCPGPPRLALSAWPTHAHQKRIPRARPSLSFSCPSGLSSHCLWPSGDSQTQTTPPPPKKRGAQGCGPWAGLSCGLWTHINCRLLTKIGRRIFSECRLTAAYGAYPTWAVTSTPSMPSRVAFAKVPFWTGPWGARGMMGDGRNAHGSESVR